MDSCLLCCSFSNNLLTLRSLLCFGDLKLYGVKVFVNESRPQTEQNAEPRTEILGVNYAREHLTFIRFMTRSDWNICRITAVQLQTERQQMDPDVIQVSCSLLISIWGSIKWLLLTDWSQLTYSPISSCCFCGRHGDGPNCPFIIAGDHINILLLFNYWLTV